MSLRKNKQGFTLIELIFATTFFSLLLIFVITAFLRVSRSYNQGFNTKITQDAARVLLEDIVRTIRTSKGPLVVYDEFGESPLTDVYLGEDEAPIDDGTVLRICASNRRFGWNEYNSQNQANPPTADGLDSWNNLYPNQLSRERNAYTSPSDETNVIFTETITAIKTDVPESATQSGVETCEERFDFTYLGTTTSALSSGLRIHDLDVDLISSGGPGGTHTYKITLVVVTADIPQWLDFNDWEQDWVKNRSTFTAKGLNADTGFVDDGTGVKVAECLTGDGSEFCKVVRLETVASTRN